MHPAYSIIVFTVASGAGFGLLAVLGLAALMGATPEGGLYWAGFVLGFGLSGSGLLASTFHLGRPERAWRAFSQWRSSWLSREGVLAVASFAIAGAFALVVLLGGEGRVLGLLTALCAAATVYATSMIYAQLKTVGRWHTPLTPAVFLAFALACGVLQYAVLRALFGGEAAGWPMLAAVTILGAWALKSAWWRRGDAAPALSTPETATGLGHLGRVRMFEAPHTGDNYLLKEMGYAVARRHRDKLRLIAFGLGGVLPTLAVLLASWGVFPALFLLLALAAFLAGLLAERWLFFAEAEHSVMTYYNRA